MARAAAAAADAPRVLLWCDTTAAVSFETGIQRVTRRLAMGLARGGMEVVPAGWDVRSRLLRVGDGSAAAWPGEWLLVPEIPLTALRDGVDAVRLGRAYDLRVAAVVHDLVPLRRPHDYCAAELDLYRRYFRSFAGADLVLATTEHVAGHLRAYLAAEELRVPPVAVVPLPAQFADVPRQDAGLLPRGPGEVLRLLAVSTWEPRKNLVALVRAVAATAGRSRRGAIHLTLVGRRGVFPALDAELLALAADMPEVAVLNRVGDEALAGLYQSHHAGVYPSLEEGFGMPVGESLWLGRPCLCHAGSAMAEVAPGGGTLMLDMADGNALGACLAQLVYEPAMLEELAAAIAARPLRSWADYAADVRGLILAQRPEVEAHLREGLLRALDLYTAPPAEGGRA